MKKLNLILILILALLSFTGQAKNYDKEVKKAYELRMAGKADEALTMLKSILAEDSTVAMAHYEMARTLHYLLLGGGGMNLDEMVSEINKAVAYAPQNVTYAYYQSIISFLKAYLSLETGQGDPKAGVTEACAKFENVLALKPDYGEAMLYLVEFYGMLPEDMGGDKTKAAAWQDKLAAVDPFLGAKGKAALAGEDTDFVKYWEDLLVTNPSDPRYLAEAGKACLFKDDTVKAMNYFNKAISADPSKNILMLDMGRYHMMMTMQKQELASTELPTAKLYFEKYLNSQPAPIIPLKAYTLGLEGRVEMFLGNQEQGDKLVGEANALDPHFSKAMGVPTLMLFDPPDKLCHQYFSFFSPF